MPAEQKANLGKPYSVSQVNRWVKRRIEDGKHQLLIKGEISNFSRSSSGHVYFTLKDEEAEIKATVWKNVISSLSFDLKDGLQIVVSAVVSVYEKRGNYQLNVHHVYLIDREGALKQTFLKLKKKLDRQGLFDFTHKKQLPKLPQHIALITSPEGAAIWDVWTMIHKRFPRIRLTLFPVLVQGKRAPDSILKALFEANKMRNADLIILTRGGGSLEDLQAFNEENVARAVFDSEIPILSAVGHESDVTIVDYVADDRALTPTEAGVKAVPDEKELMQQLKHYHTRLQFLLQKNLQVKKVQYQALLHRHGLQYPVRKIEQYQKDLGYLEDKLERAMLQRISTLRQQLKQRVVQLESLSPLTILGRGFSLTTKNQQEIVRSVDEVEEGELLNVKLANGNLDVEVKERHHERKPDF